MNDTSRCYHSGETGDIDFVVDRLHAREPATPIGLVGFSLGGNVLLKWLGEQGGRVQVFGAVAVSVPMMLDVCATRMDQGLSRLYRDRLLRELKQYLSVKRSHLRDIGRLEEASKIERLGDLSGIRSFWEYDERVIAGLYAFRDAADYYQRSSSRQYLRAIRSPTLIIQALDDPFMTPAVIPDAGELGEHVQLDVTPSGGHVGFVAGHRPRRARYWLDERIPDFLAECYHAIAMQGLVGVGRMAATNRRSQPI
jgi:predicted alpha/beta-fold hydrolase